MDFHPNHLDNEENYHPLFSYAMDLGDETFLLGNVIASYPALSQDNLKRL